MKLIQLFRTGSHGQIGIWETGPDELRSSIGRTIRQTGTRPEIIEGLRTFPGLANQTVVYDKNGKPYLSDPQLGHISFSHTNHRLAISYDSKNETGIDLELIGEKAYRIRHKFLSEAELEATVNDLSPQIFHIYWGAKEALYKLYGKRGLLFSRHMQVLPFVRSEEGEIQAVLSIGTKEKKLKLAYKDLGEYMLVYVLNS